MKETASRGAPNRLLAKNAHALVRGASQAIGEKWQLGAPPASKPKVTKWQLEGELLLFWQRLRDDPESWLNRWKRLTRSPAVFIPPWEAEALAGILVERIRKPGMSRRTVGMLRKSLEYVLRSPDAGEWATSWYFTFGPEMQRVVGEVESRKRRWTNPAPVMENGRFVYKSVLEATPRHFAREVVALLVNVTFPAPVEKGK
jgi:hypothetical protein